MIPHNVFVTGGTGYFGRRLVPLLLARGHTVRALVRIGWEGKLPEGCQPAPDNALDKAAFSVAIAPTDTFVQLVGVPHPGPSMAKQFRTVDLVSVHASVAAAVEPKIQHFVYVSVAQPAPVMKEYIAVRAEGESLLRSSGLNATIMRLWCVLGPGHKWKAVLLPVYWVCERLPATRESARRLGLITARSNARDAHSAVENPERGIRIVEVPEIRSGGSPREPVRPG